MQFDVTIEARIRKTITVEADDIDDAHVEASEQFDPTHSPDSYEDIIIHIEPINLYAPDGL